MALLDVPSDAFLHLSDGSPPWCPREEHPMNVFGRMAACFADNDLIAILIPLEHRARANAQPVAYLGRD